MTRETLQLMAALADERKIQSLQTRLERKIGQANVYESWDEQESFAYNILFAADQYLDTDDIIEMLQ